MKKFFRTLLLAAVALMPVMGMAQTTPSQEEVEQKFQREMKLKHYEDSVERARLTQLYEHQENMAEMENINKQNIIRIFNEDIILLFVLAGVTITIVALCLRHSRKKAEDQKELINKLIDNNLLNSTETISKETIEALMNPNSKKSEKERFITDATLLGLGIGSLLGATAQPGGNEELIFVGMTLAGLGLLRLIIRTITTIIERKKAKNKVAEDPKVVDAEIVEEK